MNILYEHPGPKFHLPVPLARAPSATLEPSPSWGMSLHLTPRNGGKPLPRKRIIIIGGKDRKIR